MFSSYKVVIGGTVCGNSEPSNLLFAALLTLVLVSSASSLLESTSSSTPLQGGGGLAYIVRLRLEKPSEGYSVRFVAEGGIDEVIFKYSLRPRRME